YNLGANIAIYDVANHANLIGNGSAFLGNEGRISGDTIYDAPSCPFFQFVQISGIQKEFHLLTPFLHRLTRRLYHPRFHRRARRFLRARTPSCATSESVSWLTFSSGGNESLSPLRAITRAR